MRLKNQLLLLLLSVLLPAFFAAIVAVMYVYREEQAAQEQGMMEAARAFSLLVDNELQSKVKILHTLSHSPALVREDFSTFYEFARRLAPTLETTIILFDTDGRQLLNTRVPYGAALPRQRASNIDELMRKYGATSPLVSDVFIAPIGKRFDFILQVPIIRDGRIRHFLVMGVNAVAMQALLTQQNLPPQWLGVIVDRQGVIVARSRDPGKFVGKRSDESIQKLFATETVGIVRSVTLDHVPVKTFFHRVPHSDWTIVLSIPEAELRRSAVRGATFLAFVMVILLAAAWLVARHIAARLIGRMHRLGDAAARLERGEEVSYHPQGLAEVDAVGLRIVDASIRIQQNKTEMEQRIAQAVAENERAQRALLHNQKMEALGRLTGGIAHEFNNLLQTLTSALQLARVVSNQERVQSLIDTCNKALKRAASLTGQLSAFGRIQDARLETVGLGRHLRDFEQLVENILPPSMDLEVRSDERLWPVTIDPTQFELALINLVINAKDAMPDGGRIIVAARNEPLAPVQGGLAAGEYVHISVADTGLGMPAEVMSKALDPFFTTKKLGEGTGLGLPQAYGFARQSGGTLLLRSRVGSGTTVDIYLPKAAEACVDHAPDPAPQDIERAGSGMLLFVEDDPLVRESVVPALVHAGFIVHTAKDADDALMLLDRGLPFDIVFSDVMMPGQMNGIDLAKDVRMRFPRVRVVLATGYSEQRVSMPGVQVLPKPYRIADALQALRQAS